MYALADQALRNLTSFRENQCIIITGESGSGKTEVSRTRLRLCGRRRPS